MKCLLINLEKEKERLIFMKKQLNDMQISFDRFDAIDVSDYSESDIVNLHTPKKKFTR